jgi:hypothetical protein
LAVSAEPRPRECRGSRVSLPAGRVLTGLTSEVTFRSSHITPSPHRPPSLPPSQHSSTTPFPSSLLSLRLASFCLAIGHRTSNVVTLFRVYLRQPSRLRLQYNYYLQFGCRTANSLQHRLACLPPARMIPQSFSFLVPPSSVHTACNILVSTTWDSPINTPSMASPKPGGSGPLVLHLFSFVCSPTLD